MSALTSPRRDAGFTLVEVLAAGAILLMALLALSSLFILGMKHNAVAKDDTVMTTFAMDKLEQIERLSKGTLQSLAPDPTCQGDCEAPGLCPNPCYPQACPNTAAAQEWVGLENPIPDPQPDDDVHESLYVREWRVRKVNLGQPVGCVYKITVTVGSKSRVLAPRPAVSPLSPNNPRRIQTSTYR